tara:strand:+ start:5250 stop:5405 length:156 start_codon:yes stop_codon:yes gene_type:complete
MVKTKQAIWLVDNLRHNKGISFHHYQRMRETLLDAYSRLQILLVGNDKEAH